jgi:hypothetical protein
MKRYHALCALLVCGTLGPRLSAAELPGDYFQLMEAELERLPSATTLESNPGAMFAAAVLYLRGQTHYSCFTKARGLNELATVS